MRLVLGLWVSQPACAAVLCHRWSRAMAGPAPNPNTGAPSRYGELNQRPAAVTAWALPVVALVLCPWPPEGHSLALWHQRFPITWQLAALSAPKGHPVPSQSLPTSASSPWAQSRRPSRPSWDRPCAVCCVSCAVFCVCCVCCVCCVLCVHLALRGTGRQDAAILTRRHLHHTRVRHQL